VAFDPLRLIRQSTDSDDAAQKSAYVGTSLGPPLVDHCLCDRECRRGSPGVDVELVQDVLNVRLGSPLADVERVPDLAIRFAVHDQAQHLYLAGSQSFSDVWPNRTGGTIDAVGTLRQVQHNRFEGSLASGSQ
jgi:hypothetical protein